MGLLKAAHKGQDDCIHHVGKDGTPLKCLKTIQIKLFLVIRTLNVHWYYGKVAC